MPQIVCELALDGRPEYVNSSWVAYSGLTLEAAARSGWQGVLHPDDLAAARDCLRRTRELRSPQDVELRYRAADGSCRWFLSRLAPIVDGDRVVRFIGAAMDIDDRKRAESERERLLAEARESDRRKDEFLGMLSHELRNPLAPIRNSVYLLERAEPGSEQAAHARAVIERQAEHLTRLVDDLLDVTRIARGKIQLRRERLDLREVVRRTADDLRPLMQARHVAFHVSLPPAGVWTVADATRITQVVGNLLHNAAKFTRPADLVELSLRVTDGAAEISVRDTGAGIDPALLPHVFDVFVQGDRTLARTEGGLGIGLSLVKGISELHGGAVQALSAGKGKGAEFVVRLPLVTSAVDPRLKVGGPRRASAIRRVLVVDDNRDGADSLAQIVELFGHVTEVAYDGPSALERARANPPDVVLCDLGLPGMSGFEVARALRASATNRIQLVAVSGYAQPEDAKAALEAGFDRHLAKPASPDDIERLLE
jgi:PAS domain S-box-containing protein